jgi:NCS2 family nucleobase:cation symporter-2
VTSRVVAYAAAAVLVVLAFLPKVATVFLVMPMPVAGAILVFTASLMLAAGLQLVTSKPLDTRAMLVIGIGILISLVKRMNPAFFEALPEPLHIVSSSALSLSLVVGIGLTLLFRLGRREEEIVAWRESDKALATLKSDLDGRAADWDLEADTIDRVVANVRQTLRLLKEGGMLRQPLSIALSHRRRELEVELRYEGLPLDLAATDVDAQAHEEAPIAAGLRRVAIGVHPDAARTSTHGERVKLRMTFNT